jgi:hypothetical protein
MSKVHIRLILGYATVDQSQYQLLPQSPLAVTTKMETVTRQHSQEPGSWNSDHGMIIIREHISNHTSPPVMPTIIATSVALTHQ